MAPHKFLAAISLSLVAQYAVASDNVPLPPAPPKHQKRATKSDYFTFTCKVYINIDGTARTVEVLRSSPPLNVKDPRHKDLIDAVVSAALTWTFNPNRENGKPVAGYAIVPISIDFSDPVDIGGT